MFKKLKDKITEEVKSSPQRIQQFAQAAQAAVTSASSSISDISNNDLFSIADDETPQNSPLRPGFRDVSLNQSPSPLSSQTNQQSPNKHNATGQSEDGQGAMPSYSPGGNMSTVYPPPPGSMNSSRLRRLSNSSNASDVSFRLPSYETPGSMYHLQSDLDVSASEMEDNMSVPAQLERLSKEHLYAAYRRTNEKYNKYRGRYTDLARHYRNLERENVKARAVLVETQDKALRRISELREQCSLEQSAKAHLENALRLELDERNLKIDALNTKIKLLQSYSSGQSAVKEAVLLSTESQTQQSIPESQAPHDPAAVRQSSTSSTNGEVASPLPAATSLIDFSMDQNDNKPLNPQLRLEELQDKHSSEMQTLNNKMQKLEQLLVKCKETIKSHKEKNGQLTTEIQIVSAQLDKKNLDNDELSVKVAELDDVRRQLDDSKIQVTGLRKELDTFEEKKSEDILKIQSDLNSAREEIKRLSRDVDVLNKREEENVISLAENKLSVHKELETKEKEIIVLKNSISGFKADIKTNTDVVDELNSKIASLEEESVKINNRLVDLDAAKDQIGNLEGKLAELRSQNKDLDAKCITLLENVKCNELQLKQEADEKLAVIDRNNFLEGRNKHLSDDNAKKNKQVAELEKEIIDIGKNTGERKDLSERYEAILNEFNTTKLDYDRVVETNEELENELNKINVVAKDLEIRLDRTAAANDSLQTELNARTVQVDELRAEIVRVETEHGGVSDELARLKSEYAKTSEEMESKVKLLEKQLSDIPEQTESALDVRTEMKKELERLEKDMQEKYDEKLSELEKLKSDYEKVNCELDLNRLKVSENGSNADKVKQVDEECAKLLKEKNKCDMELQSLSEELEISKSECLQLSADKTALESKILTLETENIDVKSKTDSMVEDIKQLQMALGSVQESHSQIVSEKIRIEEKIFEMERAESEKLNESDTEINKKATEIEYLQKRLQILQEEKAKVTAENGELTRNINEKTANLDSWEIKLKEYSDNNEVWQQKLSNILDENNSLREKCDRLKQEKESLNERTAQLEQRIAEVDAVRPLLEEAKLEKEFLNLRVTQLETDIKQTSADRNALSIEKESIQKDFAAVSNEKRDKTQALNEDIAKLRGELKEASSVRDEIQMKLDSELAEKVKLTEKLQDFMDKSKNMNSLSEEKGALEARLFELQEKFSSTEKINEVKLDDLTKSNNELVCKIEMLEVKCKNSDEMAQKNDTLKSEIEKMSLKIRVLEKIKAEHAEMLEETHELKSEKSKLVSDIEGLQAHLTKVSTDNSQLNDRLREMIANGEVMQMTHRKTLEATPGGNDHSFDRVGMETQLNKLTDANSQLLEELRANEDFNGRILDLERQNSILVEEKLELEDQIKSSMDRHVNFNATVKSNDNDHELDSLRIKHREMISDKLELEGRLADMELISRSGEGNLKGLEQKNEKLRLTNEKLERRLDEALVSLNHIRTLEENTELEYLRNILYEYLTGPTSNNMILAKVLSAVVKFDQRQTHLVLEREKERQGVLGQLGLL